MKLRLSTSHRSDGRQGQSQRGWVTELSPDTPKLPLSKLSHLSSGSVSPSRPSEDARSRSFGPTLLDKALHLLYVLCGLGLPFQTSRRHVADLAKDFPLLPTPVVLAENPGDVGVGVRVPAVKEVLVVEVERRRIGLAGRGAPLQDLLTPV